MIMSIETMLGATVEELRSIAGDESLSGAYKDSLYASADWVVAAIDRIAELEKDAARYRWLKNKGRYNDFRVEQEKAGWSTTHSANSLDEAIDNAMQKD